MNIEKRITKKKKKKKKKKLTSESEYWKTNNEETKNRLPEYKQHKYEQSPLLFLLPLRKWESLNPSLTPPLSPHTPVSLIFKRQINLMISGILILSRL